MTAAALQTWTYPAPTPEVVALLARLLAERGVELRVSAGGELLLRDRAKRLDASDRKLLHHYRHALADWLAADDDVSQFEETPSAPIENDDGPRCDRCGSTDFVEVAIHDGASVRRDCARCRRTWGFPVWRGGDP